MFTYVSADTATVWLLSHKHPEKRRRKDSYNICVIGQSREAGRRSTAGEY